jgi:hypothetical protein
MTTDVIGYPRWWFDWILELQRFGNRVVVFLALMHDPYPSTTEQQSVHLDCPAPTPSATSPLAAAGQVVPGHPALRRAAAPRHRRAGDRDQRLARPRTLPLPRTRSTRRIAAKAFASTSRPSRRTSGLAPRGTGPGFAAMISMPEKRGSLDYRHEQRRTHSVAGRHEHLGQDHQDDCYQRPRLALGRGRITSSVIADRGAWPP